MDMSDEDREALDWQLTDVDGWIAHVKATSQDADKTIAEKVQLCKARRNASADKRSRSEREEPDGSLTDEQIRTRQEISLAWLLAMHEAAKSAQLELARVEIEKDMDQLTQALSGSGDTEK